MFAFPGFVVGELMVKHNYILGISFFFFFNTHISNIYNTKLFLNVRTSVISYK